MIRKLVSSLAVALGSLLFLSTTLHAEVVISTQPQPVNVLAGDVAVFTVSATGTGTLTYQWKQDGNPITGATNAGLVLNPVSAANAGSYTVDISDTTPGTVTSSAATLTLRSLTPGDVDFSFAGGTSINNSTVSALAVQSDGKVVIGGSFVTINGAARGRIARLNPDGSTDYSFGNGLAGVNNTVSAVALQSDGKVVIGGTFATVNGAAHGGIARLNPDGSLDTTFGNGLAGVNNAVSAVALQSDGKVVIGGTFTTVNGTARGHIARLNSDGSLDTTFADGLTGANGTVYAVAVQSGGQVLIGGSFSAINGTTRGRIARLNSDGTLDTTFGNGLAGANNIVYSMAVQSDGQVVIGGQFIGVNGTTINRIARLNSDGSLDTTFGNGLTGANGSVTAIAVQSDGQVLIGGSFSAINGTARGRIAQLNSDGSLDTTFGNGLAGGNSSVSAIAPQSEGKVLLCGGFTTVNGTAISCIARLNSDGTLDTSFGNGLAGPNAQVNAVAVQSDGQVLIGGLFTSVNGMAHSYLARLNDDGTLDTTFGNGLAGANGTVYALAAQSDGQVLIGGAFTSVNGTTRNRIARLNDDGTLDTTFGDGLAGANSQVNAVAVQGDGKVVIGGQFTSINGTTINRIARLNSDGTLDTSFGSGLAGANNTVFAVAVQSNGKVVIGGQFTSINGTTCNRVARLNSDGTLDTTFGDGLAGANNTVNSLTLQSDGKVLIGGSFTSVNGTGRSYITRLNSDGTLDTTFGNGQGGASGGSILAIAVQSDGKVVIGGNLTAVNRTARSRIARLNNNGTLDTTFGSSLAGANNTINAVTLQGDDKVVIGGNFTTINDTAHSYLARLILDSTASTNATLSGLTLNSGTLVPAFAPETLDYTVTVNSDVTALTLTPITADINATVTVNGASAATPVTLNVGTNLITIQVTAQDGTTQGNYLVSVIRLVPNTPPTLTLPDSPIIAEATGPAGAGVNFTVSANDAEDGPLTPVMVPVSGSIFPLGDTIVSATVTDSNNASVTNTFTVRVVDTTAPLITVPGSLRAGTSGAGTSVSFSVSASDLVDGAVTAVANPASGSVLPVGTNTITVTATDTHGNSASNSFLVFVSNPPPLYITTVSSNLVTVSWQEEPGWHLLETTNVTTTATDWSYSTGVTLTGNTNYLTLTNATDYLFYRLSFP